MNSNHVAAKWPLECYQIKSTCDAHHMVFRFIVPFYQSKPENIITTLINHKLEKVVKFGEAFPNLVGCWSAVQAPI